MHGGLPRRLDSCFSAFKYCIQARHKSSSALILRGDKLGPVREDDHQTFRLRKDGSSLPLPPLLDPVVISERSKWEQTKQRPDVGKFTPFQKKLSENPYAHILASPVRQCKSTGTYLPSDLLITLNPQAHPKTLEYWLVPVGLTKYAKRAKHPGPPFRFFGRQLLAEYLGQISKNRPVWKSSIYPRFREQLGSKADKMVWREDMPHFILKKLREQLFDKLKWYFKQPGRLLACKSPRAQDIEHIEEVSCVLYFGSLKTPADEVQARANIIVDEMDRLAASFANQLKEDLDPHLATPEKLRHPPPKWWKGPLMPRLHPRFRFAPLEFPLIDWRGSGVAVYSLTDLLGEEMVKELMDGSHFASDRCVAMPGARHNVSVQVLLMRVQAYVAACKPTI
ncbi:hypothetical protein EJ04DRAFT_477323 [Polyplosphaeria fusca]|uniref:Uncharacterized protein n=1 Tax=Polyplosphaeria fusca TaxID=682080 RepID=A0A9P4UU19_9PLEO|nr:hypothetical protein EJ04DRAFT_477323 [Polyplosphaeria fusca]